MEIILVSNQTYLHGNNNGGVSNDKRIMCVMMKMKGKYSYKRKEKRVGNKL
jgi:hypothetical protein